MHKFIPGSFLILIVIFISCQSSPLAKKKLLQKEEKVDVFPVTDFLLGQINEISKMPVTLLKVIKHNSFQDSQWVSRDSIGSLAIPFLSPVIDSIHFQENYSAHSFLDQTVDAFTFTYDALKVNSDSFPLTHVDVYVDPDSRKVKRIYMVKEKNEDGNNKMQQLTWNTEDGFIIRTILQGKSYSISKIIEERVTWKF